MKSVSFVVAVLLATTASVSVQTRPAGTWRVDGVGWSVFLKMEGPRLTGLVSHCATTSAAPAEIHDSSIAGNTITFKCTSSDRDRTLTFTGVINGDAITLDWEKRVRNGGLDNGAVDQIFGPLAPRQFTAKRVPDGELAKAADEVRGLEFAAAVNLLPKDTKAEGLLFVPRKLSRVRTVIVVIRYGLGSLLEGKIRRRLRVPPRPCGRRDVHLAHPGRLPSNPTQGTAMRRTSRRRTRS